MDVTPYIKSKSNQLNADDLMGGALTVQIHAVERGTDEQPVVVRLKGGHMPWKPSKTALRILAHCWGKETDVWVGRWVSLYRDESVSFGGREVGGIRPSHLSHIDGPQSLNLAVSRGKKKAHNIKPLHAEDTRGEKQKPTANLDAFLADEGLTREDVDRWLKANKKPSLDSAPDKVPMLAAKLASKPEWVEAIKVLRDAEKGGSDPDLGWDEENA